MLSFAAKGGNPELPPGREFKPGLPGSARSKSATGRPADGAQGHPDDARRPSEDVGLGHADRFVVRHPQQTQKYLLNHIRDIGRVANPRPQERPQPLARA